MECVDVEVVDLGQGKGRESGAAAARLVTQKRTALLCCRYMRYQELSQKMGVKSL